MCADALQGIVQTENLAMVHLDAHSLRQAPTQGFGHQRRREQQGANLGARDEYYLGCAIGDYQFWLRLTVDQRQFRKIVAWIDEIEADFPPVEGKVDRLQATTDQETQVTGGTGFRQHHLPFSKGLGTGLTGKPFQLICGKRVK